MVEKKIDLDDVLEDYKLFQRYHVQMFLLIFFALATNYMYCSNYVFAAEEVSYRCADFNNSYCYTNLTETCSKWVYENPDSFVAYFQLACQEWKRTLIGTAHGVGCMVGLIIVGPISDKYGRKTTAITLGVLGGVFGILRSFSAWYWFYIAMEFLEAAIGDICSPIYVLATEITSTKNRLRFTMMCCFGIIFGGSLLPFMAWLIPNWRWFLRAIYLLAFLFLFYIYLLDESPRWLLTKGRKGSAITILENAAKKNKMNIEKNSLENLSCVGNVDVSYIKLLRDTFRSKKMRTRFFVCIIWWTTSTFVTYGMLINSVSLKGNKYINFALTSLVDFPANLSATYTMIYFKRKIPLMISFFAGAILCIAHPFLPTDLPWLSVLIWLAGKLMCTFYFCITYMYTSELFPTYTRNSMHALCSSIGRIGTIIAPQTPLLMIYWSGLPSLVFGLAALFAGLTTFLVPDLSDISLPDTVGQAEALGESNTSNTLNLNGKIS